jgi:hypothetical protein
MTNSLTPDNLLNNFLSFSGQHIYMVKTKVYKFNVPTNVGESLRWQEQWQPCYFVFVKGY